MDKVNSALLKRTKLLGDVIDKNQDISIAFLVKIFIQASLPHSNPKDKLFWEKRNGNYILRISSGEAVVNGETVSVGVPYGCIPRIVLTFITTEALQKKSPIIHLGCLSKFIKKLGYNCSGGIRGDISRIKEQMVKLFHSRISVEIFEKGGKKTCQFYLIEEQNIKWINNTTDIYLESGSIKLSDKFYQFILKGSVPLNLKALMFLKKSALSLDLYAWLTYRMNSLQGDQRISWLALHEQFGSDYRDISNFKKKAKKSLSEICFFYQGLNLNFVRGGLVLHPSNTHIEQYK